MRVDNDIKSSRRCPCGEAKDLKKLSRVSTKSNDALTRPKNQKTKRHADTAIRLSGYTPLFFFLIEPQKTWLAPKETPIFKEKYEPIVRGPTKQAYLAHEASINGSRTIGS